MSPTQHFLYEDTDPRHRKLVEEAVNAQETEPQDVLAEDWTAIERLAATNRPRQADREALNAFGDIPGEEWSDRDMAAFILRVRRAALVRTPETLDVAGLRREIEALPDGRTLVDLRREHEWARQRHAAGGYPSHEYCEACFLLAIVARLAAEYDRLGSE